MARSHKGGDVAGVSVRKLRAAVAAVRQDETGSGVTWPVEVWERLWQHINPRLQRIVYMHALLGQPLTSVADQLGERPHAVADGWRRAVARIRAALPVAELPVPFGPGGKKPGSPLDQDG